MKHVIMLTLFASVVSCASRAPSSNELDRKAGLSPSLEVDAAKKDAKSLRTIEEKSSTEARREGLLLSPPRVERIWVYGQELSPSAYLDGTHVFLEVTAAEWTREEGASK